MGICIGGHLALRAAFNPDVRAAACFYATDIHSHSLGRGTNDDTLLRMRDVKGELLMVWGRQDPHIPRPGRRMIQDAMDDAGLAFTWHEGNGQHAFLRDEGNRYDPALARLGTDLVLDLFHRRLAIG
jgi:carboxymethylenebutenolidase